MAATRDEGEQADLLKRIVNIDIRLSKLEKGHQAMFREQITALRKSLRAERHKESDSRLEIIRLQKALRKKEKA